LQLLASRRTSPRYGFCVHMDAASLESVLTGPKSLTWTSTVWFMSTNRHVLGPPDPGTYDWNPMEKDPETNDPADEGEARVEEQVYDGDG
jgi:hypothetical protein